MADSHLPAARWPPLCWAGPPGWAPGRGTEDRTRLSWWWGLEDGNKRDIYNKVRSITFLLIPKINIILFKNHHVTWTSFSPGFQSSLRMLRQTLPSRSMLGWYTLKGNVCNLFSNRQSIFSNDNHLCDALHLGRLVRVAGTDLKATREKASGGYLVFQ